MAIAQKSLTFLLEIPILVLSANIMDSENMFNVKYQCEMQMPYD